MSSTRGQTQQQQFQFRGKCIGERHIISITGGQLGNFSCKAKWLCMCLVWTLWSSAPRHGERYICRGGHHFYFYQDTSFYRLLSVWHVMWKCVDKNRHGVLLCIRSSLHAGEAPRIGKKAHRGTYKVTHYLSNMHSINNLWSTEMWLPNPEGMLTNPKIKTDQLYSPEVTNKFRTPY